MSHHATTCPLDPIPSSHFQTVSSDILPFLTTLINFSPTSGLIPASFKIARVKPLLMKPTLDSADIQNYRPISLLLFLSKTLERAISNLCPPISHITTCLILISQVSRLHTPLRRPSSR